uniref:Uncharacterized protein n=1 Tax=Asparagus officinalis TaxID=4686 RepID=Q2XNZ0_ASPOF|nr:hypothetical protein 10.t00024 [Asparagus officinalis]
MAIACADHLTPQRFLHSKKEKHFLYDIVANGRTGLDKFDIVDGSRRNMKACTRALAKKMIYLSFVLYMKAMMMDPGVCSQDKRHTKVKIGGHEDIRSGKGSALQLNDLLRRLSGAFSWGKDEPEMGEEEFYILSPDNEEEEFYILSSTGKETRGGISTPRIRKGETESGISTPRIEKIRITLTEGLAKQEFEVTLTVGRFDHSI